MPEKLNPITLEKRYMTEIEEENPKLPKYKVKQKEALAWLFVALIKVDLEPLTLSLTHTNEDLLRRFKQLAKLGTVKYDKDMKDIYIKKWQLTNPKEIAFFLKEIKNYIHTQSERNISELLISQCNQPNTKTEDKLKPLIQKHNIYFNIHVQ